MSSARYRVLEELGRGGMGVVYRAVQLDLNREVALKVLPPAAADSEEMRRFQREVRICCGLAHPHVVRVFDGGEMNGQPFYTMEILRGRDLAALLGAEGGVPFAKAARWLEQAADALAYIHERNLIHRDIKPANMMINEAGDLVLTDFGLARDPASTMLTEAGAVVGTPRFLPPEGFVNHPMGAPQDVWALALCAHEMITGAPWDDAANLAQLAGQVVMGPAPSLAGTPDVPAWFLDLQERALAKDPAERPTAARYRDALRQRAVAGIRGRKPSANRPAVTPRGPARPVSGGVSPSPPARPARAGALAAGLAAGLALAGAGGWLALHRKPDAASPSPTARAAPARAVAPVVAATDVTVYPTDRDALVAVELTQPWACTAQVVRHSDGRVAGEVDPPAGDHLLHTFAPLDADTQYLLRVTPKGARGGVAGWRFKTLPRSHAAGVTSAIEAVRADPEQMEYWASFFRTAPDRRTLPVIRDWLRKQKGDTVDIRKIAWTAEALRSQDIVTDLIARLPQATDDRVIAAVLNAVALTRHPRAGEVARAYAAKHQRLDVLRSAANGIARERTAEAADLIARYFENYKDQPGLAPPLVGAHRGRAREHFRRWTRDADRERGMWLTGIEGLEMLGEDPDVAALEALIAPRAGARSAARAIQALVAIASPPAREAVGRLFRANPRSANLLWAVGCLGLTAEREAVRGLLSDRAPDVRRHGAGVLALLFGPAAAIEPLRADPDPSVAVAAAWALERLRTSPPAPGALSADVRLSPVAPYERTGVYLEPGDCVELSMTGAWTLPTNPPRPVNADRGVDVNAELQMVGRAIVGAENPYLHRAPVNVVAQRAGEVLLTVWRPLPLDFSKVPAIPGVGAAVVHVEKER